MFKNIALTKYCRRVNVLVFNLVIIGCVMRVLEVLVDSEPRIGVDEKIYTKLPVKTRWLHAWYQIRFLNQFFSLFPLITRVPDLKFSVWKQIDEAHIVFLRQAWEFFVENSIFLIIVNSLRRWIFRKINSHTLSEALFNGAIIPYPIRSTFYQRNHTLSNQKHFSMT